MIKHLKELETPSLIINEEKMNRNLHRMMSVRTKHGVNVRPHFKTHKSIAIAKKQLELGAIGITVATATEAELLLDNGIEKILIAFPLTDRKKISRLLERGKNARLIFAIDSEEQAAIFKEEGNILEVEPELWIKVNSGLNRCGVEPREETVQLATFIKKEAVGKLSGLFTHAGHSYAAASPEEIDRIAKEEAESILTSANACENAGIPIEHRSVGSTPTFERAAQYDGITEVRPGNAVFFDAMQVGLGTAQLEETALTVLATVVSKKKGRFIIDTGSKSLTTEKGAHGNETVKGFGKILNEGELYVTRVSEEHGIVEIPEEAEGIWEKLQLNQRVEVLPNHACPVVNLFDYYYVLKENGDLVTLPVDGRGKSQ
ncbi:D-serine deaminase-like pyridoxal phosphate-dependent protein [Evansella vedderi]|uniref:D-serine deaminase-like pyridoxal phosphate-dependent protein n=1 Tax=Evansella vedderi TaxID=38282 RepID=A0ABT9ZSM1_9BACI|nr:alanine racemase [Evansella vedderi]MDQ0253970.1 D-serine deaminase-like pyridoxal phosphate-dependent protein [Evansella vedderi]